MSILLIIILGLAPGIIWLLFYLRKDSHPESNRMIIKIFFYGMMITLLAALSEIGIASYLNKLNLPPILIFILYFLDFYINH